MTVHTNHQEYPQTMVSTNTVFNTQTRFDIAYVRTLPGLVKVVVIVLDLIAYICIQASSFWWHGPGIYFIIVAVLSLGYSSVMLGLYLYHVIEKYHNVKWLKIEMVACILITLLYLIAATIVVAYGSAAYSAGGFFGYIAMVLYGFDAWLKARAAQAGDLAQGARLPAPASAPAVH